MRWPAAHTALFLVAAVTAPVVFVATWFVKEVPLEGGEPAEKDAVEAFPSRRALSVPCDSLNA
ncbi:hypothetical protein H180DRAFT_05533 [Streptomyces sp. WMMB 322]|nr:hypothetical protein H180DRAFT_05533 [Streptomyces sp. WMMB 322]